MVPSDAHGLAHKLPEPPEVVEAICTSPIPTTVAKAPMLTMVAPAPKSVPTLAVRRRRLGDMAESLERPMLGTRWRRAAVCTKKALAAPKRHVRGHFRCKAVAVEEDLPGG